jgi:hypothetical protein
MKPETEIRNLKRELRTERIRSDTLMRQANIHKTRADKAERESEEWERRFDVAMNKIPDVVDDIRQGTR